MKYIDFYEKKKALHDEMLEAIVTLFNLGGITEIDFEQNCELQNAYIILSPDGIDSTYETKVSKIRCKNNGVSVLSEGENKWISCEYAGRIVSCTLETLYDAVYDYVTKVMPEYSTIKE